MDLSRATASAICKSSSRLAATVDAISVSYVFGALSRLQIFVDELVGENEFRVCYGAKRKFDIGIIGPERDVLAVQPQQRAAESFAPINWKSELDLGFMAGPAGKIHQAGQRAVDTGR